MAVIPRDAVQMPPRAASPGLPPVDPVKGRWSPPSGIEEPTWSAVSTGEVGQVTDSRPATCPADGPGTLRDDFFEFADADKDAAPDPSGSFPETVVGSGVQADGVVLPGTVFHPRGGDVDEYPGRCETNPDEGGQLASAVLEGSHDPFMQAIEPVRESRNMAKLGVLDSLGEAVSSCATVGVRRRLPARIAARPDPTQWSDDELLTLPEAAALFWPDGPITTNTLRTAGRDGALAITKVAGKFFTTPMAIRRMGLDEVGAPARPETVEPAGGSPQALFLMKLAEAKRLGGERARPKRAAKRSVAPAATSGRAGQ